MGLTSNCISIGFILSTTCALVFSQVTETQFEGAHLIRERLVERGESFNFTCTKALLQKDRLSVERDGRVAGFASGSNLEEIQFIDYDSEALGLDILSSDEGELMSNPPRKLYSIHMGVFSVSYTDSGLWTCRYGDSKSSLNITVVGPPSEISFTSNSPSDSFNITMIEPPITEEITFNVHVEVDKNIYLLPSLELLPVIKSTPPAQHKWFKGEEDLMGGSLDLERSKTMRQTYLLNTYNEYGELNATVEIYPRYAPEIETIKEDHYPTVGEDLYIRCEVDAQPDATIFFVKNHYESWRRLESGGDYTITNGLLIIRSVDLTRDVGEYLCIADNLYGKDNRTFNIHGEPLDSSVEVIDIYGDTVDLRLVTYAFTDVRFLINASNSIMEGETWRYTPVELTRSSQVDKKRGRYLYSHSIKNLKPETEYMINVKVENTFGEDYIEQPIIFTTASANVTRPVEVKTEVTTYVPDEDDRNTASILLPSLLLYILTCLLCVEL